MSSSNEPCTTVYRPWIAASFILAARFVGASWVRRAAMNARSTAICCADLPDTTGRGWLLPALGPMYSGVIPGYN